MHSGLSQSKIASLALVRKPVQHVSEGFLSGKPTEPQVSLLAQSPANRHLADRLCAVVCGYGYPYAIQELLQALQCASLNLLWGHHAASVLCVTAT